MGCGGGDEGGRAGGEGGGSIVLSQERENGLASLFSTLNVCCVVLSVVLLCLSAISAGHTVIGASPFFSSDMIFFGV